jgi:hypothetical protein
VVETAKTRIVCLLGKDESLLEGMSIPTRLFTNGRGLKYNNLITLLVTKAINTDITALIAIFLHIPFLNHIMIMISI